MWKTGWTNGCLAITVFALTFLAVCGNCVFAEAAFVRTVFRWGHTSWSMRMSKIYLDHTWKSPSKLADMDMTLRQRWGKPMNRHMPCSIEWSSASCLHIHSFRFLVRLRVFRIFWRLDALEWHGPSLREKLVAPQTDLPLSANAMYWLDKSGVDLWLVKGVCFQMCVF